MWTAQLYTSDLSWHTHAAPSSDTSREKRGAPSRYFPSCPFKTRVCFRDDYFPFFPPIIHAFKTGIDSFLPPEILSDEEMSLTTQEECPVWYWQTPTRFETEFSLRILVICDPGVSRSRLCVLALIPGFAQIGTLLWEVFQHNQCHSHCPRTPPASFLSLAMLRLPPYSILLLWLHLV